MTEVFDNMPTVGVQTFPQGDVQRNAYPQGVVPAAAVSTAPKADTLEISQVKPKKQGPIKKLKGAIANFKKFFATTGEYIKGTVRGVAVGGSIGAITYTVGDLINKHREKIAAKTGVEQFKKIPNKVLAGLLLVGSLAVNLWKSSLNASEKRSEIEHRWTGHN